jgi:hypothetical protein
MYEIVQKVTIICSLLKLKTGSKPAANIKSGIFIAIREEGHHKH